MIRPIIFLLKKLNEPMKRQTIFLQHHDTNKANEILDPIDANLNKKYKITLNFFAKFF